MYASNKTERQQKRKTNGLDLYTVEHSFPLPGSTPAYI